MLAVNLALSHTLFVPTWFLVESPRQLRESWVPIILRILQGNGEAQRGKVAFPEIHSLCACARGVAVRGWGDSIAACGRFHSLPSLRGPSCEKTSSQRPGNKGLANHVTPVWVSKEGLRLAFPAS